MTHVSAILQTTLATFPDGPHWVKMERKAKTSGANAHQGFCTWRTKAVDDSKSAAKSRQKIVHNDATRVRSHGSRHLGFVHAQEQFEAIALWHARGAVSDAGTPSESDSAYEQYQNRRQILKAERLEREAQQQANLKLAQKKRAEAGAIHQARIRTEVGEQLKHLERTRVIKQLEGLNDKYG
ncbi:hypothetical protein CYMTET_24385 [Cymbomonas tetramitiformis]|uniref:Uncharacterized protein n=1 Tax=Cymbomonas tetramitiformis TaxID=36881 RepID=A0AAE0BBK8_9CHLO|nr:hypothetical protein CYMTET_56130 [Cymbomonas tetramitiformis]KAK3267034.1 hypothetical protein CYMTET_24385 [Cymbomonas tetramitiformis]